MKQQDARRAKNRRRFRLVAGFAVVAALAGQPVVAADVWFKPPSVRHVERAWQGDARAQAYLGYLYDRGAGVPQNASLAAYWYRCAALRGEPYGQFLLGLAHDKGRGVPQDYILAYAWTNMAVAQAAPRIRRDWVRMRDAIATKLSLQHITIAQGLTLENLTDSACDPVSIAPGG